MDFNNCNKIFGKSLTKNCRIYGGVLCLNTSRISLHLCSQETTPQFYEQLWNRIKFWSGRIVPGKSILNLKISLIINDPWAVNDETFLNAYVVKN